jgi:hypothetical protein
MAAMAHRRRAFQVGGVAALAGSAGRSSPASTPKRRDNGEPAA